MAVNLSLLSPLNITFGDLCCRNVELKDDINFTTDRFLIGCGSSYLFKKLQRMHEEQDQLNRLLSEIIYFDKKAVKKLAA